MKQNLYKQGSQNCLVFLSGLKEIIALDLLFLCHGLFLCHDLDHDLFLQLNAKKETFPNIK